MTDLNTAQTPEVNNATIVTDLPPVATEPAQEVEALKPKTDLIIDEEKVEKSPEQSLDLKAQSTEEVKEPNTSDKEKIPEAITKKPIAKKAAKKAVAKKTAFKTARRYTRSEASQPLLKLNVELSTEPAQVVYKRSLKRFDDAVFQLDVIMYAQHSEYATAIGAVEQLITKELEDVHNDLDNDIVQLDILAEKNGQDLDETSIAHSNVNKYECIVSTNKSAQLLNIIRKFDKLVEKLGMLWLLGEIQPKIRMERTKTWQSRIIKLANRSEQRTINLLADIRREEAKKAKAKEDKAKVNPIPNFENEVKKEETADEKN